MRVVLRVDSSIQIGTGHVMRCLTLAERLQAAGAAVSFICRELPGNLIGFVDSRGFGVQPLPAPTTGTLANSPSQQYATWPGVPWQEDAAQTADLLAQSEAVDWLIVDHYALDRQWEQHLRPLVRRIMVIDDLADRPHDCDLLLDQNFYLDLETRYDRLVPGHCRKLLGPRYALLRPEFRQARQHLRERAGKVRRIMIFCGGSDTTNETTKALEAIRRLPHRELAVEVVLGGINPHRRQVEELCAGWPGATCHCQVNNMAELMGRADLAIGAGGSTSWERFCLGLPSLVISLESNQEQTAAPLAAKGYHLYLGPAGQVTVALLARQIDALCDNPRWLQYLSEAGRSLVDGLGAERVCQQMAGTAPVVLRRAEPADVDLVYQWRNDEATRQFALDPQTITYETHVGWYTKALSDRHRVLLIGELAGREIGVLRYDLEVDSAKVSVYLDPDLHGRGYGPRLLISGSRWLREHYPAVRFLEAKILPENRASIKAFAKAGFRHYLSVYREDLEP